MRTASQLRFPTLHPTRRLLAWLVLLVAALLALALAIGLMLPAGRADEGRERLSSQPRPAAAAARGLAVGDTIETAAGQRRRLGLPGGAVLYVNENTTVKLEQSGRLTLACGEVYVEGASLTVKAPRGEVKGKQTSFAVRAAKKGTGVLVTRGLAEVSGLDNPVRAGQQLRPGAVKAAPAPRASLLLDWTRELKAAAESPLVPRSSFSGGALLAIDPNGQEAKLTLRKFHVDVFIEGGFARTTIDQTYFNDGPWQMEGTFYFPLPPDAQLSRLAMYVDGGLMEGGMVERDYARQVYETIRYQRRDPALLEWVDGSTFKMRVFPLEPRQEKRVLLSYTQKLPALYGQLQYRFPAGHSLQQVRDWSFHARLKGGAASAWHSPSHALKVSRDGKDLVLDAAAKDAPTDRDVVLALADPDNARFATAEQDGWRYLMVRLRPDLLRPGRAAERAAQAPGPRTWVFLFESSGDRDPLLARVQVEVVRGLLAQADPGDRFRVLTAGTRVRHFAKGPLPVTAKNVAQAIAFLEGSHLIGALDLGQALAAAGKASGGRQPPGGETYLVHVGSGIAATGERRQDVLAKRVPLGARYVGVGVGRRWARSLMKLAAERSGGYFTQINPDEPIGWRAFDLASTLRTLPAGPGGGAAVSLPGGAAPLLYVSRSLAPGEELCAVTRLPGKAELPREVSVVVGERDVVNVPVRGVAEGTAYLPRAWAKLEIDRLLAEDAAKYREAVIALSKAMYVMTPFTSLLVLENEDQYVQYKVDRGRKDRWALYPAPKRIPVVYEPDPEMPDPKAKAGQRLPAAQVLKTVVIRGSLQFLTLPRGLKEEEEEQQEPTGSFMVGVGVNSNDGLIGNIALNERNFTIRGSMPKLGVPPPPAPAVEFPPAGEKLMKAAVKEPLAVFARPPRGIAGEGFGLTTGNFSARAVSVLGADMFASNPATPVMDSKIANMAGRRELQTFYFTWGHLPPEQRAVAQLRTMLAPITKLIRNQKAVKRQTPAMLLYQRPGYSGQDRLFYDLVAYCPGLNTSAADVAAVLEAEAFPDPHTKPGKIDDGARALIEKSRQAGWQALTLTGGEGEPGFTVVFDGAGRYAWQRTLRPGIRERVACDGKQILHLYPQLGLAARRAVSRFHREDFSSLVPWALPPAADLARGADLKLVDERTVAVIPAGADAMKDKKGRPVPYLGLRLVFGEGDRLAERQVVHMPKGEVLLRHVCEAGGTVRLLDKDGKELSVRKGKLSAPVAPELAPDTKGLVVLHLPYRTHEHIVQARKLQKVQYPNMRFADARDLLAADFAAGNNEVVNVFRQALHAREQRQLGLYVLLAACGQNLDAQNLDVLGEHPDEPLAQYLALHSSPVLRKHASQWAVASTQWNEPYLQHLAVTHALLQRWQDQRVTKGPAARVKAERRRALDYVRKNKDSAFGWALMCLMQDRAGKDADFHAELAEAWRLFEDSPGLAYAARYEFARSLLKAGRRPEARKRFRELYERTLADGVLPPLDGDFRAALLGGGDTADAWTELLSKTAARLAKQKHRPAVLALARQCWQLDDPSLANQLVGVALNGAPEKERPPLTLAAVGFFQETSQLPQADELLQKLLADEKLARRPALWRLAADIAQKRDMTTRGLECLERALDAEYARLPAVIDLQQVRSEYGKLLEHYQNLTDAMVALKVRPPEGFLAKVVRAADRWRALDREAGRPCQAAARILRTLGDRELGWEYLTTPVGLKPNEAGPWVELAQALRRTGDLLLADRALKAACQSEPTNADYLWERAENLRQAGRQPEARDVLRQIADGRWQPRFQPTQARARALLAGP